MCTKSEAYVFVFGRALVNVDDFCHELSYVEGLVRDFKPFRGLEFPNIQDVIN